MWDIEPDMTLDGEIMRAVIKRQREAEGAWQTLTKLKGRPPPLAPGVMVNTTSNKLGSDPLE